MKKVYSGLDVIFIPFNTNGKMIVTVSQECGSVYTTHFDSDRDNVCDNYNQVGSPVTSLLSDCPEVGFEVDPE